MFEPAKLQMNWASASGDRNRRRAVAESEGMLFYADTTLAGASAAAMSRAATISAR